MIENFPTYKGWGMRICIHILQLIEIDRSSFLAEKMFLSIVTSLWIFFHITKIIDFWTKMSAWSARPTWPDVFNCFFFKLTRLFYLCTRNHFPLTFLLWPGFNSDWPDFFNCYPVFLFKVTQFFLKWPGFLNYVT